MMGSPSPLPLTISEREFQDTVIATAKLCRWMVCHFRPAIVGKRWATPVQGDTGFPDLVLARGGVVLCAELKRHGARPTPNQRVWLRELGEVGRLWTPVQWNEGTIYAELA